jgi:hypothetical protein
MHPEVVEKVWAAHLEADKQAFRIQMLRMQDGLREQADCR